ncbi:MAG TPA: winged helix-turn-helix domain-containing protein [Nitrososphaeraceae archaeon]
MRYRSRDEIIGSILQSASQNQITKTKMMFSSFLSYPQLLYYLKLLIDEDLLEYDSQSKLYRTTQKGMEFLELNRKITSLLEIKTK